MEPTLLCGDSITAGYGSTVVDASWKDACANGLRYGFRKTLADGTSDKRSYAGPCGRAPYMHFGVGGSTTDDWTPTGQYGSQVEGMIGQYALKRAHLLVGTNDVIRSVKSGEDIRRAAERVGIFLNTYAWKYKSVTFSAGTIPRFAGPADSKLNMLVNQFNVALHDVVKRVGLENVLLVDAMADYDAALLAGKKVTDDGTHPNDDGYDLIGAAMVPLFGGELVAQPTGALVGPMVWRTGPRLETITKEKAGAGTPEEVLVFAPTDAAAFQKNVVTPWGALAAKKSAKYSAPLPYVLAIMNAESGGDPRARGGSNDIGLMQIADPGLKNGYTDEQLFDPDLNVDIGARVIASLAKKYGMNLPKIASAYNCGSATPSPGTLWGLCAASQAYLTKVILGANTFVLRNAGVPTSAKSSGNTLVSGAAVAAAIGVVAYVVVPWRKVFSGSR